VAVGVIMPSKLGRAPEAAGRPSGCACAIGSRRVSDICQLRGLHTLGWPRPVLAAVATVLLGACEQQAETSAATAAGPPPAVTVISVQPTEVTPGFGFNGRVVAVDEVQLRARVTGFLEQRLFEEGADVEAGDLLFVIEKAPYQAGGRAAPGRARERRGEPG
jgi:multidrug efflux pump subunit AcrA (membrane-fusion protein)